MVGIGRKTIVTLAGMLCTHMTVFAQADRKITFLNENEPVPQTARRIKKVTVGGDEGAVSYSYSDVLNKIEELAERESADLIKIEEHEPGDKKICDRVVATLYSIELNGEHINDSEEADFVWSKTRKLQWSDFRGRIPHLSRKDMTVAATYCGFGYDVKYKSGTKPQISISNRFYHNKSWGLPTYMNTNVLEHEQAHFDLCELYTRKFRERASKKMATDANYTRAISDAYDAVYAEYERKQERYDAETEHGNNKEAQKKWQEYIDAELLKTEEWHEG